MQKVSGTTGMKNGGETTATIISPPTGICVQLAESIATGQGTTNCPRQFVGWKEGEGGLCKVFTWKRKITILLCSRITDNAQFRARRPALGEKDFLFREWPGEGIAFRERIILVGNQTYHGVPLGAIDKLANIVVGTLVDQYLATLIPSEPEYHERGSPFPRVHEDDRQRLSHHSHRFLSQQTLSSRCVRL